MSSFGSPSPFFLAGKKAYEVERSLRFNNGDSPYLRRDPTSTSNRKTSTLSVWLKRTKLSTSNSVVIFSSNKTGSSTAQVQLGFESNNTFTLRARQNGTTNGAGTSTAVFRDPSAWYHIVYVLDTTQATNTNRFKLYVNGEQQTISYNSYPAQNGDLNMNLSGCAMQFGAVYYGGSNVSNRGAFYLAEVNWIDGQAYDPSYFAETNPATGQWNPKKYTGSYGTNGFYLNFSDNSSTSALGTDSSGNGNNFTPNNFSVSAGAGNDSLEDTPTNNFATLNSLKKPTNGALSNGNLDGSGNASSWVSFFSTILVSSGKWFCEVKVNATRVGVGIAKDGANENSYLGSAADTYAYFDLNGKWNNNSDSAYGATYTTNDIIGMALDMDAGTLIFYKNGASQGTAFTGLSGEFALGFTVYGGSASASINYGQRAFSYTVPTGYKSLCIANLPDPTIKLPNKHFGTLLWTGNATVRTISDTSEVNFTPDWVWVKSRSNGDDHQLTDSVRGSSKALKSNASEAEIDWDVAYSGNNKGMGDYVNGGFILDDNGNNQRYNRNNATFVAWNWNAGNTDGKTYTVKVVSDSGNKYRFDDFGTSAVTLDLAEGGTYTFDQSDSSMSSHPMQLSTTANGTHGGGSAYSTGVTYELDGSTVTLSAFISGFSSASSRKLIITVAASAPTLYYYCYYHSGMGGAVNTNSTLGSSNFSGSIQSTVKANTTAGFSIVTYTGNGTGGATIGHGLGVTPNVLFVKNRGTGARIWLVYHSANTSEPATEYLQLDGTAATGDDNSAWNDTAPTSTVFSVGTSASSNNNGEGHVAYCFSEVAGYSKFGSYTGNGNADGTFVFTNFRPALIILKRTDTAGYSWVLVDSKKDTFNVTDKGLIPNLSDAEGTGYSMDFLSNGFKLRLTGTAMNASGATYIYLCFAESPFKNARAR